MVVRRQVTTIAEAQDALDRNVTLALLTFVVLLQLYAALGRRRDHVFRACVTGSLSFLVILHQWEPLRGTVLDLQPITIAGDTIWITICSPPGASLVALYAIVLGVQVYGVFVAFTIWKRGDRMGAVLVGIAAVAIEAAGLLGVLVDFGGVRVPHVGALPHAFFVICMALFLAREYSARASRIAVANRQFETTF